MTVPPYRPADRWIWVALPYATFALGVENGKVVVAPRYAWKIIGKLGTAEERAVAEHLRGLGTPERPTLFRELPSG